MNANKQWLCVNTNHATYILSNSENKLTEIQTLSENLSYRSHKFSKDGQYLIIG